MKKRFNIRMILVFVLVSFVKMASAVGMATLSPTLTLHFRVSSNKIAFVLGSSQFPNGLSDIPQIRNDVQAMKELFLEKGFDVLVCLNPTKIELDSNLILIKEFIDKKDYNLSLFYYSGYGS